ncbi:MAG: HAD family hydrolase [Firmicutes bacterium]|nr:HAD family hydrolase [Bacillota bacterium]
MGRLEVCGKELDIDLVIFDKDGCLFESKAFWTGLAESRAIRLAAATSEDIALDWLNLVGMPARRDENGGLAIYGCDPMGPLALAPPSEEIIICASVILKATGWRWPKCRETAEAVFYEADRNLDLDKCIVPRKGFPGVFERLSKAGVPFGIATSDEEGRARASIGKYTDLGALSFIVTPEDVVHNKPDRETIDLIAGRFGIKDNSRILMVGDSYVDMLMARSAGAYGMGVPEFPESREEMRPFASFIAGSLDELRIAE